MPSQSYRQQLLDAFLLSIMIEDVISPPETLEEASDKLQQNLEIISLIEQTCYLQDQPSVPKYGNIHLAWDYAADPAHHHHFLNMLCIP